MTEKRFYLMNVEDPLHEYGRWCKPVLEDGETGKQYENALEVMDLLNELHEENQRFRGALKELKTISDYQAMRIKELDELKECPMCKSKDIEIQEIHDIHKRLDVWKLKCLNCKYELKQDRPF